MFPRRKIEARSLWVRHINALFERSPVMVVALAAILNYLRGYDDYRYPIHCLLSWIGSMHMVQYSYEIDCHSVTVSIAEDFHYGTIDRSVNSPPNVSFLAGTLAATYRGVCKNAWSFL